MAKKKPERKNYDAHREAMAEKSRERSKVGREIGPLPKVQNPKRRAATKASLKAFCDTYLADRFNKPWGDDQIKVASKMDQAMIRGGLFALAMPRGSGKTTLCEADVIRAICHGHRKFLVIIGATGDAAIEILDSIKMAFETNDLLAADFPEVCFPIRMLDGISHRAKGQMLNGERTRITWTDKRAVFPTVKGSKASGARIHVVGIDGRIRGMKAALADGTTVRPDHSLADDPQTDESAASLMQIEKNERRLLGAVKGLAGPGKTISMMVPCTVINPGDLSQRLLDRKRHPQFGGEHMKMVYAFPKAEGRWDEYAELRRSSFDNDGKGEEATAYYLQNRAEMQEGAKVAWEARFDPESELDAIQAAMNIRIDNPREFWAEYQNEPMLTALGDGARRLEPAWVSSRLTGLQRLTVPKDCSLITTFVDPGTYLIWFATVAWNQQFGGSVLEYGCWPKQPSGTFTKAGSKHNLAAAYKGLERDEFIHAGLAAICGELVGRTYIQHGTGVPMRCDQMLIDCGHASKVVEDFIRGFATGGVKILPSRGKARSSDKNPVGDWPERPGELKGTQWRRTVAESRRGYQIQFDTDYWKSFIYERWATPLGGRSTMMLYGSAEQDRKTNHELFASHMSAEYGHPEPCRGVVFEKWLPVPATSAQAELDNDWFDCLTGCAVGASVAGLKWYANPTATPPKRKKIDIEQLYARQQGAA